MNRRLTVPLALLALAVACGSPVENATGELIEQVRLGDPLAQGTYGQNRELIESPEALPIWLDALENSDSEEVRVWAAQILGNIGDGSAVGALTAALGDSRDVRDAAVAALKQFDAEVTASAFVNALSSDSTEAQATALIQLSRLEHAGAVSAVADAARGDNEMIAAQAMTTLGDLGGAEAAEALAGIAADATLPADTRRAAIMNLGRIDDADAAAAKATLIETLSAEEGAEELLAQAQEQ